MIYSDIPGSLNHVLTKMEKEKPVLSLGKIKGLGLIVALYNLTKDDLIYRCDFSQISKHFLSEFLPVKPFSVDFKTLLEEYIKSASDVMELKELIKFSSDKISEEADKLFEEKFTVPETEKEFHEYVCRRYLNLIKEPRQEILANYIRASDDLKAIDSTLSDIKIQMLDIETRNQAAEIRIKNPCYTIIKIKMKLQEKRSSIF
jgi:hypothetical protein